jgi:hypothetical protein
MVSHRINLIEDKKKNRNFHHPSQQPTAPLIYGLTNQPKEYKSVSKDRGRIEILSQLELNRTQLKTKAWKFQDFTLR